MTPTPDLRHRVVLFTEDDPMLLDSGGRLDHVDVAYETWGTIDADRGNAVFVCHALTGDSHATGTPESPGWWETMIGPGRPVDTDRFFVVCPNLLGGCRGTTGPASTDPATGTAYGLDFPLLTVRDFVTVHRRLAHHLGLDRVLAAIGGSLGVSADQARDARHASCATGGTVTAGCSTGGSRCPTSTAPPSNRFSTR